MPQLEHIEAIEKRLWSAADNLRARSNCLSNEHFLPVMGLIFLRHAYSRYLAVKDGIEANLLKRGGNAWAPSKEDFSQKGAIYLRPEAQFDTLVALPDSANRAKAIQRAMDTIEEDYERLKGVLPRSEYAQLDNEALGLLLRTLNSEELKSSSGDGFGLIYEYFLTQFADLKAHDGGEFFTPVSLVQMIANVIEPEHGTVLDPACGSGGMFVQSAHFVERLRRDPATALSFYGMEKNATTVRLAKMNLAVHGLEGAIQKATTYYEVPHELAGKADFVMANPPFNVDEVDADKIKNDPRLPFGLPGVNKAGKVSNANYLWISYFHSYLGSKGRAGFVMSSQASSAGRKEARVRQKVVESGDVDVMIAIGPNFFYTRTVPCELWFFDRGKPKERRDKVLMLDARGIYHKVTRKIYGFSPEQLANLTSIVWLHRGEAKRFLGLVKSYLERMLVESEASHTPLRDYLMIVDALATQMRGFAGNAAEEGVKTPWKEFEDAQATFAGDAIAWIASRAQLAAALKKAGEDNSSLKKAAQKLTPLAETSRDLVKQAGHVFKLALRVIDACEAVGAKQSERWNSRELARARKDVDEVRRAAVEQLKQVRYFHRQAHWLQQRFPEAKLVDVPGLVRLVGRKEIQSNDWSLTPERYVGVAPEEVDEDFDFETELRGIHVELQELNAEAADLAATIARNFEELGV